MDEEPSNNIVTTPPSYVHVCCVCASVHVCVHAYGDQKGFNVSVVSGSRFWGRRGTQLVGVAGKGA